jgi:hypothetical protein
MGDQSTLAKIKHRIIHERLNRPGNGTSQHMSFSGISSKCGKFHGPDCVMDCPHRRSTECKVLSQAREAIVLGVAKFLQSSPDLRWPKTQQYNTITRYINELMKHISSQRYRGEMNKVLTSSICSTYKSTCFVAFTVSVALKSR